MDFFGTLLSGAASIAFTAAVQWCVWVGLTVVIVLPWWLLGHARGRLEK